MLNFLKAAFIILAEIIVGIVWAFIYIAGVVLIWLLAYGLIKAFVEQ